MVASTLKNGKGRLRKGNRLQGGEYCIFFKKCTLDLTIRSFEILLFSVLIT